MCATSSPSRHAHPTLFDFHHRPPAKTVLFLCAVLFHSQIAARADSATVAANANTLIAIAAVQSSPNALATGYSPSQSLTLANAEK